MARPTERERKRVRYTVTMAGDQFVRNPGDEVTMPAAEADRLIAAGFAVEVEGRAAAGE